MFENLNDENQLSNQAKQGVDDIFSETDQVDGGNSMAANQEINTRRAGLGATSSDPTLNNDFNSGDFDDFQDYDKPKKGFTIAVIVMAVVILALIAFLVYNKFIHKPTEEQLLVNNEVKNEQGSNQNPNSGLSGSDLDENFYEEEDSYNYDNEEFEEVDPFDPFTEDETFYERTEGNEEDMFLDSDQDGLSDYDEINIYKTDPYNPDTDGDGVTDYDELYVYGTDPLVIDTDGDGLTDYEELFIYNTNPSEPDTDGDGYTDGEEVRAGYSPITEKPELLVLPLGYENYTPILFR